MRQPRRTCAGSRRCANRGHVFASRSQPRKNHRPAPWARCRGMTKSHHKRRPTCQTRSNESAPGGGLGVQVIHCSTPPLAGAGTHPGARPIATFPSAGLAPGDVSRFRAAGLPLCPGPTPHGGQSRSRRTLPAGYFLSTLRPGAVALRTVRSRLPTNRATRIIGE